MDMDSTWTDTTAAPMNSVLLAVRVDPLCRVNGKRIVRDLDEGCGPAALDLINGDFELRLMQYFKFSCTRPEVLVAARCEKDD